MKLQLRNRYQVDALILGGFSAVLMTVAVLLYREGSKTA